MLSVILRRALPCIFVLLAMVAPVFAQAPAQTELDPRALLPADIDAWLSLDIRDSGIVNALNVAARSAALLQPGRAGLQPLAGSGAGAAAAAAQHRSAAGLRARLRALGGGAGAAGLARARPRSAEPPPHPAHARRPAGRRQLQQHPGGAGPVAARAASRPDAVAGRPQQHRFRARGRAHRAGSAGARRAGRSGRRRAAPAGCRSRYDGARRGFGRTDPLRLASRGKRPCAPSPPCSPAARSPRRCWLPSARRWRPSTASRCCNSSCWRTRRRR